MENKQKNETAQDYLDLSLDKPSDDIVKDIFGGIDWVVPETNFNGLSF